MSEMIQDKSAVATTILQQLGGREFLIMTGSKNLVCDESSLRMRLIRNRSGANILKITLCGDDLYDMVFTYHRAPGYQLKDGKVLERKEVFKEIKRYEGVYCDMLHSLFTEVTGLETHLPKVTEKKV